MKTRHSLSKAVGAALAATLVSHMAFAFEITFDYSLDANNFFSNNPDARDRLEQAGSIFEARIEDSLAEINPNPGVGDTYSATFTNPSDGTTPVSILDFPVSADTIIIYAAGRGIGGSTSGRGQPGGFSGLSGSQAFFDAVSNRGNLGAADNPATDFARWGGAAAFDTSSRNWYFGTDPTGIAGNQTDFLSVALHEIAHIIGFSAGVFTDPFGNRSWANQVDKDNTEFTGANAVAAHGGNVLLTSDWVHWAEGTQSSLDGNGPSQEAAMDPTLTLGTRKLFTVLDWAGLEDIGWEIASPAAAPIPATALLVALGLPLLVRRRGLHHRFVRNS